MPKAETGYKRVKLPSICSTVWDKFCTRYSHKPIATKELPEILADKIYSLSINMGRFKDKLKIICGKNNKKYYVNPDYYYDTDGVCEELKCVRAIILTFMRDNIMIN